MNPPSPTVTFSPTLSTAPRAKSNDRPVVLPATGVVKDILLRSKCPPTRVEVSTAAGSATGAAAALERRPRTTAFSARPFAGSTRPSLEGTPTVTSMPAATTFPAPTTKERRSSLRSHAALPKRLLSAPTKPDDEETEKSAPLNPGNARVTSSPAAMRPLRANVSVSSVTTLWVAGLYDRRVPEKTPPM